MLDTKKSMNKCSSSAMEMIVHGNTLHLVDRVNANVYNCAGHSKSLIERRTSTVVGKHVVVKLFTRSAARLIMNKRMHNEQNNEAHKMNAGVKWETLGVA